MTTSNVNSVEMVNNSVESNNATMGNIEELTKVFEKEEKELNRLVKGNRNEAVIAAQQKWNRLRSLKEYLRRKLSTVLSHSQ